MTARSVQAASGDDASAGEGACSQGARAWRFGIETGGTFTDCIAVAPDGRTSRAKVLSAGTLRLGVISGAHADPRRQRLTRAWAFPCSLAGFIATDPASGASTRIVRHDGPELELEAPIGPPDAAAIDVGTGEPGTVLAARLLADAPPGVKLPPGEVRFATTRGTNALLERRLTPTALFVTRGFGDLLEIGDQRRPDLYAIDIRRGAPLYALVIEVDERLDASGAVLRSIDLDACSERARRALALGVRSAAIALLHSWCNPAHEEHLAARLCELGFEHVSRSAALSPRIRVVHRARTATVNAALSGEIGGYLRATAGGWPTPVRLDVMTSAGGLVPWTSFEPKDCLLSGPAAGVRGASASAARAERAGALPPGASERLLTFDVGGTSTDVTRIERAVELTSVHRVGDAELLAPALPVHSVAAGGGSICELEVTCDDAGRLIARPLVGPRSAGADPGPACYGRGGPLTITDVNLLLGRLDPERFGIPVSVAAAERALEAVCRRAREAGVLIDDHERAAALESFRAIANQRMSAAIGAISFRRGFDPSVYVLVAFGGAGGQHACAVADELRIRTILCPADGSLLSAAGLLASRRQCVRERQVLALLDSNADALARAFEAIEREAIEELARTSATDEADVPREIETRVARLRFKGQDHTLDVPWEPGLAPATLRRRFESRSRETFGYVLEREVEIESIRVVATQGHGELPQAMPNAEKAGASRTRPGAVHARQSTPAEGSKAWPTIERSGVGHATVAGPLLIVDDDTTVVVEPGWSARASMHGDLVLERTAGESLAPARVEPAIGAPSGPIKQGEALRAELLAGRLEALGEAMGEMLARTALSTNVKERLDYSCAILDADGRLVVSAPHVPVHLGALGVCVRALRALPEAPMGPGDVLITNHPAFGGSHLPDVTLVAPAHDDAGDVIGYVACRAHHAEIGGTRPGSMPPDARRLAEEGVVIAPMHLVRAGDPRWAEIRGQLTRGSWPSRAVEENLADLRAQLAAVRLGVSGLLLAAREAGASAVERAMARLLDRAAHAARSAIARAPRALAGAEGSAELDDGAVLRVRLAGTRSGDLLIDFAGSAGLHPRSLNAPEGVIHSAVMYVVRLLAGAVNVGEHAAHALSIPLNDGLMRSVRLMVPSGMLSPPWEQLGSDPSRLPAVAGGNVETSQQVVNLLVRLLGIAAESQGTMNNLLFGAAERGTGPERAASGYYETIGGGAGASAHAPGASGVHTHMTNTAITDPEILESRSPVRLDRFAIRRGSGGAGRHAGGDGLERQITFLAPMSVSLLTSNRHAGPRGLEGGLPGAPGEQSLRRAGGVLTPLRHADAFDAGPGDQLTIRTPGGGGFGPPAPSVP
ncbi:MAG: hydantoinase B/oxoprolinase family protein [Phycisphaerales bacterium]